MAVRYIGDAVIRIFYRDGDTYVGSVCVGGSAKSRGRCWKFDDLNAPRGGFGYSFGYDSAEAYDSMAKSAVGFGSYYTTHNRGDDVPDWAPEPEVADAIEEAVSWAQDDRGEYEVRRSAKGKARTSNPKKITKTSTVSTTTTRVMNPGFFSNPWRS